MKALKVLLLVIAVVCIGVAASYPIRYQLALRSNNAELEDLSALRRRALEDVEEALTASPEAAEADLQPDGGAGRDPASLSGVEARQAAESAPTDGAPSMSAPTDAPVSVPGATGDAPEATWGTDVPASNATASPSDMAAPLSDMAASPSDMAASPSDMAAPLSDMAAPLSDMAAPPSDRAASPSAATASPSAATASPSDMAAPPLGEVGPTGAAPSSSEPEGVAPDGAHVETARPSGEARYAEPSESTDIDAPSTRAPGMEAPAEDAPTRVALTPEPTEAPSPTPDRSVRTGALAYEYLEKVELDESKILPELREIYALNRDLVGWISIEDTPIDYPVVQTEDSEFYLKHDFYGNANANGQIILDAKCDPYTPSYNLVISGHHMNSGAMFGRLPRYKDKKYWEQHRFVEFDNLMARKRYVIFAVFYSADYDVDEKGFRYNVDVRYKLDADRWLAEIRENQRYDTGIDVGFGDEFITLTTCDRSRRKDGRFVVVARRIREGETFEQNS